MSAIDSLENAHVKDFFKIPVYWVLEDGKLNHLIEDAPDDAIMNQFYLSVGGGSGEHPALILNNDALIIHFLDNIKENEGNEVDKKIQKLSANFTDTYIGYLSQKAADKEETLWKFDQNQWPLDTFIEIHGEMKKLQPIQNFKDAIMDAFALLIIYDMPLNHCLKDPQLIEVANLIKSNEWSTILEPQTVSSHLLAFQNIEKQKSGKVIRNNKAVWGYSLEDWKEENNSIELSDKLSGDLAEKKNTPKIKI